MGRSVGLLLLLLALLAASPFPALGFRAAGPPSLEVVGTLFRVTTPTGRVMTSPDLIGAVLDVRNEAGQPMTVRIDSVDRDRDDPDGDIWLHRLSVRDAGTGNWRQLCGPAPDGVIGGFPLAGNWTKGRHLRTSSGFIVTCASGAIGKCVRLGYKPWASVRGQSLWNYHQACVHMMTADYGGDGLAHTRDGTSIDFTDRLKIRCYEPDQSRHVLNFEAAWGPNGAVCVRRTRIPELLSLKELAHRYPRLVGKIGPNCSEAVDALFWDRS
jgi:hypothetical protein